MSYQSNTAWLCSRAANDKEVHTLTRDVAFNRLSFDKGEVKSPYDTGTVWVGTDGIEVKLVQGIEEDSFRRTLSRAVNATLGVDPNNPPEEADWEEMLQGGLQTALETQVIVFEVARVSRTCTHQLVRSRRAAFHQQSQRAHYYGSMPDCRMPESVWVQPEARRIFLESYEQAITAYNAAAWANVSYQDARFVLPEATVNYIMLEYPVREFLNVYAYRACPMFQWEICDVMRKCKAALVEAHPWTEPYVKISCEKTQGSLDLGYGSDPKSPEFAHHCTFQGWEEVEGQCDKPYARETNRQFRSKRHAITRG